MLGKIKALSDDRGMTTAEYAVGTVATVSIVGVLIAIINNPEFRNLIWELVKMLVGLVTGSVTV